MQIRRSNPDELKAIQQVHRAAFGADEGPTIVELVADMLSDASAEPLLSLVAERDQQLIGSVLFTPVQLETDGRPFKAYILAPLAVSPGQQQSGVGTALIRAGLKQLNDDGVELVFVYGDPNYYSRTGFEASLPHDLHPPHAIEYPEGWQVQGLVEGALEQASGCVTCCESLSNPDHW